MGHRRFLQKKEFDGKTEKKVASKRPSGDDIVTELGGLRPIIHGKVGKKTSNLRIWKES